MYRRLPATQVSGRRALFGASTRQIRQQRFYYRPGRDEQRLAPL
jgi:hypothetical protein